MLMTKNALEAGDAGALEVAALHDDRGVEVAVDARRRSRCRARRGTPSAAAAPGRVDRRSTSLPSARSAKAIASCDPIASPSGRDVRGQHEALPRRGSASTMLRGAQDWSSSSWIVSADRRSSRNRSALDVVQQLLDAVLSGDRLVVAELELGHAPQPQPRADLAAQERRRALERLARSSLRALSSPSAV